MAITVNSSTALGDPTAGPYAIEADIDLDASYATGGYDLSGLLSDLPSYTFIGVESTSLLTSGRQFVLDSATQKLIVVDNAGAEIAATTDLSAMTDLPVTFYCK